MNIPLHGRSPQGKTLVLDPSSEARPIATAPYSRRSTRRTRDDWADIIDLLTLDPDERRKIVRLLGGMRPAVTGRIGFLTSLQPRLSH